MKAYERLNVEVVKFEAQDVITASVAAPPCICQPGDGNSHWQNQNVVDHGACQADTHPNCTAIN